MRVSATAAKACHPVQICKLLLAAAALLAHVPTTSALCSGRWAAAGGSSRELIVLLKVQRWRHLLATCMMMLHACSHDLLEAGGTPLGCSDAQDAADLAQLRLICTPDAADFNANRRIYAGMHQHCHMPAACRHIYTHALIGAPVPGRMYTSFICLTCC